MFYTFGGVNYFNPLRQGFWFSCSWKCKFNVLFFFCFSFSEIPGVQPEDFMDTILRFGLYLGAVFQLICIAAVIVVPERVDQSSRVSWSPNAKVASVLYILSSPSSKFISYLFAYKVSVCTLQYRSMKLCAQCSLIHEFTLIKQIKSLKYTMYCC